VAAVVVAGKEVFGETVQVVVERVVLDQVLDLVAEAQRQNRLLF
jgi:hypothetical protein